jgi:hypothetical protein
MYEEIQKIQLKKVETPTPSQTKVTHVTNSNIQNSLAEAIKQRRIDLTKNDIESEGSEDDWSD